MKELKRVDISADIFNSVLRDFSDYVEIVEDIKQYFKGYQPKWKIYYDGKEYLICREFLVDSKGETWKQVIYRKREELWTDDIELIETYFNEGEEN